MKAIIRRITIANFINLFMFLYVLSIYILTYRVGLNTISNALALILIVLVWVNVVLSRKSIVFNKILLTFLIFILICLCSTFFAISQNATIEKSKTLFLIFLVMITLVNYTDSYEKLKKFITYFIYSGLLTSIYILLTSDFSEVTRFGGELGNVNSIGLNIGLSSIFCFYIIISEKKYWYSTFFIVMIPCILLTGSRKALIFVIFNMILILYLQNRRSLKKILKFSIITILVLTFFYYMIFNIPFFYEIIGDRMENLLAFATGKGSNEGSINIRYNMTIIGLELFKSRPFTGYGIDNYRYLYAGTYSHNNFIELMVGTGIVGVIFYYLTQIILIKDLSRISRYISEYKIICYIFIAIAISYIILSPSIVYYYDKHINFVFAIGSSIVGFSKNTVNGST